ncbi:MAG: type II secretion system GspH family protein [Candidatus Gastranaerophilales bacterium]|nr:type II secretion system GspH family protein [Candidatus Gastranaerophilales bacterium]
MNDKNYKIINRNLSVSTLCKRAFTLAEVLITLVIIGVIAAITVPTIMANHQKQETAAKLKKFYSTLSNAIQLEEIENPGFIKAVLKSVSSRAEIEDGSWNGSLGKYMPVTKTNQTYTRNGSVGASENYSNVYALNDGSLIIRARKEGEGSISIFYDTNGYKAPNRHGKDIYKFTIQSYRDYRDRSINWTTVCTGEYCSENGVNPIPRCNKPATSCNNEWPGDCARYIQCNGWKMP